MASNTSLPVKENETYWNNFTADPGSGCYDIDFEYWKKISFPILFTLFLIGAFGNLTTIIVIVYKNYLKKVTYTAIALLAVTDFVAVIVNFTFTRLVSCENAYHIIGNWSHISTIIASNLHVIILFRLRYLLIVKPVESISIKPKEVIKQSGSVWIFSLACGAISSIVHYVIRSSSFLRKPEPSRIVFVSVEYGFMFLTVFIPTLFFHCRKVKALKFDLTSGRRADVVKKMNILMTVIITIQISSRLLVPIITAFVFIYSDFYNRLVFVLVAFTVDLFNHVVNPIIFFSSIVYESILNFCRRNFPIFVEK